MKAYSGAILPLRALQPVSLFEEQRARQRRGERARAKQTERIERAEQHPLFGARLANHANDLGGEAAIIGPLALELDVDEERLRCSGEDLGEERNALARLAAAFARAEESSRCSSLQLASSRRPGTPPVPGERGIVEDHHLAGSAELRVELDSIGPLRGSERECSEGVLWRVPRSAAVGPDERPIGAGETRGHPASLSRGRPC